MIDEPNSAVRPSSPRGSRWILPEYAAEVSIIIVSFNTCDVLKRALRSICELPCESPVEVIVIDNASRDASAVMVRDEFPKVKCVANSKNLGHTGGCNQGIELARGRYLMLLNSDTILQPGALEQLADYLDRHPRVGAVGPKVLNLDGTIQGTVKRFPTPAAALFGRFSILTRWLPRNSLSRRYLVYLDEDFTRPFAVDSASAAALMVRREAIEAAGLLDPRFFLYWNDVDWCRSIWASGFEIHCVPQAVLHHEEHHGGSRGSALRRLKTLANFHLGAYHYYRKWHVRKFWHPNHLLAIIGLTLRAAAVITVDQFSLLIPGRKAQR